MAEVKTKPTKVTATSFLKTIEPKEKREDALALLKMFEKITKQKPVMWGTAIVGFGTYHYKSPSTSREGDWMIVGFSPRKANLTLYVLHGTEKHKDLFKKLGKHKTSGSGMGGCLYINKLSDVDLKVLAEIIKISFNRMKVVKK